MPDTAGVQPGKSHTWCKCFNAVSFSLDNFFHRITCDSVFLEQCISFNVFFVFKLHVIKEIASCIGKLTRSHSTLTKSTVNPSMVNAVCVYLLWNVFVTLWFLRRPAECESWPRCSSATLCRGLIKFFFCCVCIVEGGGDDKVYYSVQIYLMWWRCGMIVVIRASKCSNEWRTL